MSIRCGAFGSLCLCSRRLISLSLSYTQREYHHFKDTQSPQPHSFWWWSTVINTCVCMRNERYWAWYCGLVFAGENKPEALRSRATEKNTEEHHGCRWKQERRSVKWKSCLHNITHTHTQLKYWSLVCVVVFIVKQVEFMIDVDIVQQ